MDWAASTDNFTVELLTSGPGEAVAVAGSVPVFSCSDSGTATIIRVTAGNQPVGGVGISPICAGITGIKGIQIPANGNSPGVDPCAGRPPS